MAGQLTDNLTPQFDMYNYGCFLFKFFFLQNLNFVIQAQAATKVPTAITKT